MNIFCVIIFTMKDSKYINKYDFIDYYTKQPEMWFFTNSEIQTGIDLILTKLGVDKELIEENDDEFYNDEYDSYEYFSQLKIENDKIDENNPLIIEGNIIDGLSKEKIKQLFKLKKVIDFDNKEFKNTKMEDLANKTKELLSNNEKIMLFQPVFIFNDLITKPDALVKDGNKIEIIETKCTTTSKLVHLLDLLFQKKVIEKQYFLKACSFEYKLCLVSYNKMNRNEVDFIIAENCNISKSAPSLPKKIKNNDNISSDEKIKLKQMLKIGKWFKDEKENLYSIPIIDVLNNDWNALWKRYEITTNSKSKNAISYFKNEFSKVLNNFDSTIQELLEHKKNMTEKKFPKNFTPSKNDKNFFKNCNYWIQLKSIYAKMGYSLFLYSGYVANQTAEYIAKFKKNDSLSDFLKISKKNNYVEKYINNKKDIILNEALTFNTFSKLKKNKVYFDFESINTAIRNVDNSLPFNQIVTQCSIIKWFENEELSDLNCDNLIIDPKNIHKNWFKEIINKIYVNKDNISYVVYNKAFEITRLKDMAEFINEKDYYKKSKKIIDNIFDLADFFDPRKNLITIKKLYGFYSIKKVLALIEKENSDLFDITKSKNYQLLKIKNGVDCQQKTVLRFFDKINDYEWKELSKQLKEYCENDVRAMIAVELFIKKIIQN
ncbi:MAG: DUF2779 domain-containing protein [Mycoplasmoidaceae bacterium]